MNNIKNYNNVSSLLDLPIKELQDIPVYIFDKEKFKEVYEHDDVYGMNVYDKSVKGCFLKDNCPDFITLPSIMMVEEMPIENQIFVFFHEYGHYQCYNSKCSCFDFAVSSEMHAWRNSFKLMLHYKCYQGLAQALRILNQYKTHVNKDYTRDLYDGVVNDMKPLFRQVEKWVKNCPKKYKDNLIRIENE